MLEDNPVPNVLKSPGAMGNLGAQSFVVGSGLILSRALGFVRDAIIAYRFGTSFQTDAYLISAQVPLIFDTLLAGSALYIAMTPIIQICATNDAAGSQRLARLVRNATTLVLMVSGSVSLVGIIFSSWLVRLFGGGFPADVFPIATGLMALTLLGLPFIGLTNVAWAVLNSKGHYWGPALSLSYSNMILIIFALVLGPSIGIYALGIGYGLGVLAQAIAQYFELSRTGVPIRLGVDLRDPDLLMTLSVFWPLALGGLVNVLSPAVDNFAATFLPAGGVATIRYAYGLTLPFSILSMSISIPAFGRLSQHLVQQDFESMTQLLQRIARFLSFVLFGVAAWLFVVREPVVALVYMRGAFDQIAAHRTASALGAYVLLIPFGGINYFLMRGVLAFSKSRFVLTLAVIGLVLNLWLDLVLLPIFAEAGIGLSSAGVQIVNLVAMVIFLDRLLKGQHFGRKVIMPVMANGFAALAAVGLAFVSEKMLSGNPLFPAQSTSILNLVIAVIAYFLISYASGFSKLPLEILPIQIRTLFHLEK